MAAWTVLKYLCPEPSRAEGEQGGSEVLFSFAPAPWVSLLCSAAEYLVSVCPGLMLR